MYNPFVPFTEDVLFSLRENGVAFLIIQRFSWPGLSRLSSFFVTPYTTLEVAMEHLLNLGEKEGKLFDINAECDEVLKILNDERRFNLFLDKFKETHWNKRMLQEYQRNITSYLSSRTNFTRHDTIDINFVLKHGHLLAEVRAKDKSLDVNAIDLIK